MQRFVFKIFSVVLLSVTTGVLAAPPGMPLEKVKLDPTDKASLQRGAKAYMQYCAGCHSLDYIRYKRIAEDIGLVNEQGEVDEEKVKQELIYTDAKIQDTIKTALSKKEGQHWFGLKVPDLTLSARVRGKDWLYTYLRNFYADYGKIWGTNNRLFPDVGMPHVLVNLQGVLQPKYRTDTVVIEGEKREVQVIESLEVVEPGLLTVEEYNKFVTDLVNFLAYTAEPEKVERQRLGLWVLGFLIIFAILSYLLKREYWRDVESKK